MHNSNQSSPYFSVIIPVYKVEKYLEECVSSVLQQTYSDFEIILVDDGSPDSCPQLCDEWARKDSRIIAIHKENGGLSSARNTGLERAVGEYIIFLDSDDYWKDNSLLQTAFDFIRNNNKSDMDVVLFQAEKYSEDKGVFIEDKPYNVELINGLNKDETIKYLIESGTYSMSACTKILNRDMLVEKQVIFEEGLLGEDLDWFYKLTFAVRNIYAVSNRCYVYRFRNGSITHTVGIKNIQDSVWTISKWSNELNQRLKGSEYAKYYFGILAYAQVVNMLNYTKLNREDKKQVKFAIKKHCYLLKYEMNLRIRMVNRVYRIFGFNLTTFLLALYYKLLN